MGGEAQCNGYFMHTRQYWSEWGCRCCTDANPGEQNDSWNMFEYSDADMLLALSDAAAIVVVKTPSIATDKSFTVDISPTTRSKLLTDTYTTTMSTLVV